jgi:G3E family GTPase
MVETTGMADPGPVAQTFFVDDEMQQKLKLDGIVTLVDAKHVWQHIDDSDEVKEQIAFADVIILNKTDLVTPEELDKLKARVHSMNAAAKIYTAKDSAVAMDAVLNVGGFNLDRALEVDPKFMEPEYPFEWGGVYELPAGTHKFVLEDGPDPTMEVAVFPTKGGLKDVEMDAVLAFSGEPVEVAKGTTWTFEAETAGRYALFTQHHPDEFNARVEGFTPIETHEYKPDHEHDEEVSSVGITTPGDLDEKKFQRWLSNLLQTQGPDIFRMKGVLSMKGKAERFVFQGVHMLFDGRPDRAWKPGERENRLIFIGRNLDREKLNEGFRSCLA